MGELAGELAWPAPPAAPLEPGGTVAQQAPLGLPLGDALAGGPKVAQEEVDALLGIERRAGVGQGYRPPINVERTACSVGRRLAACWKTTEREPSITAALTSSPRCAGRQCMKTASSRA